ncbi:hypothetical protein [Streptomyces sp. NPDC090022]|uniref:hypothetical protein n=1 Tax=Streptomyces sp. NPDC090022 TaxID=3365920 RepID=UPI00381EA879
MSTWRARLSEARTWQEYRGALHALREGGPAFRSLPALSEEMAGRGIPGLQAYTGVATYNALVNTDSSRKPKWDQVELLVRICAEHQGEPDVTAVVADWAAAYHRCGGDPGPRFPVPHAAEPAARTPSRRARSAWLSVLCVLALAGTGLGIRGIVGAMSAEGTDGKPPASSPPDTAPPGTTATGPSDKGPLFLTSSWPTYEDCDGATSVAMPAGGPPLSSFQPQDIDFRKNVTAKGGATWGAGHLYLTLSAEEGKTVVVQDIRPSTPRPIRIGPPAWIAVTQGGCGDSYNRVFSYDLDRAVLTDRGIDGKPEPGRQKANANPLGPAFTVSAADPAVVRVDVSACEGNYEWGLIVDYAHAGHVYRQTVGPFRSMGVLGEDTVGYTPDPTTHLYGAAGAPPAKGVLCP